ncbi:MAG: hypothetical protein HY049_04355 [Acidobacteria bacterium]|nr:hypothetical protein [Acidobacteriota bacterium]
MSSMFRRDANAGAQATETAKAPPPAVACPLLRPFLKRVEKLQPSPSLLLFGEMCGANVSFLGARGLRVSVEGSPVEPRAYDASFSGAILWDHLSRVRPEQAASWIARLVEALVPGGAVLAFFPPVNALGLATRSRYRIASDELVTREPVGERGPVAGSYQNREIIRLFGAFNLELLHTHRSGDREALFFKA